MPAGNDPRKASCEACGRSCQRGRSAFPLCHGCRQKLSRFTTSHRAVSKRDENDSLAPPERIAELADRASRPAPLFPERRRE